MGDRAASAHRAFRDPLPGRVLPHRGRRPDRRALALPGPRVGIEEPQHAPYTLGAYGDGEGLAWDPKQIVLDALARNPEAAREALTTPLEDVEPWDLFGQQQEVTDPVRLLYDYGEFDDDGDAFGRAYIAAASDLFADPRDTGRSASGTCRRSRPRPRHSRRPRRPGQRHRRARPRPRRPPSRGLHYPAAAEDPSDLDGGRAGGSIRLSDHRIHLSRQELVDVLAAITEREDAGQAFLADAARYQAAAILAGTRSAPDFSGDFSWAHRAGSSTSC